MANFWEKSNHTHLDLQGARVYFRLLGVSKMTAKLVSLHTIKNYDQSALQRRDALKETGRFYTRQEKTPKMFSISGGFSPVSPLLRTPLVV